MGIEVFQEEEGAWGRGMRLTICLPAQNRSRHTCRPPGLRRGIKTQHSRSGLGCQPGHSGPSPMGSDWTPPNSQQKDNSPREPPPRGQDRRVSACPAGQGTLVPASIPDPAPPSPALEGGRKFRSWGGRSPGADTKNQRWGRGHLGVSGSRVGLGSKLRVSRLAPQGSFWWSLRTWELYPRPPRE